MNITRFAIHRPLFATMIVLGVIIIGGISLSRLPLDLMPDVTYPTISVFSTYENASPEEIEELVTRPIEEAMAAVPGVEEISSESSEGSSTVRLTFSWGTDLDAATADVRDRIDRIISRLPEDMDRPMLRKFDPSMMPILILGASSNLDPLETRQIIDEQIKYRIEKIPGVASLNVWGGLEREIRVSLYPDKIRATGIPLDKIISAIKAGNITQPAGTIERGNYEVTIRTPGQFSNVEQIKNTVITTIDGVNVMLRDIASVEDTSQKVTRIIRVNGKPGIYLAVTKQSGSNTVEVATKVLKEIGKINEDFKQIKIIPIIDNSDFIRRSIASVRTSILFGGLFAILVLLFFLRSISSTAIVALAIPVSIIATFSLMYFGGFTLNVMTLGGLALGVGMLVDSAIVVLENIYRLREKGISSIDAAVNGTSEVSAAVVASTLTTIVVFLPLIFMKGMAGVMFKQLAMVVSFSLICSLLVALTLIPMLSSRYLKPIETSDSKKTLREKMIALSFKFFEMLENTYKQLLLWALSHRKSVISIIIFLFVISFALVPLIGVELMPQSDEGEVRIEGEMDVGTKLSMVNEKFQMIENIVKKEVPEIKSAVSSIGGSFRTSTSHYGEMRIALKPKTQRKRSSEQIASALRKKLSGIPGIKVRTRTGSSLFTMMFTGRGPMARGGGAERVQVEIRGYQIDVADNLAEQIKQALEQVEGITDVRISREAGVPEEIVVIDRLKAASLNLNVSTISNMLNTAIGGSIAGYFREAGKQYRIFVQMKDADRMPLNEVLNLTITNAQGQQVLLRNVVHLQSYSGPVSIERKNQERIVTVLANTGERNLRLILEDIKKKIKAIPVPAGFEISIGGEYEQQQKTFRELIGVLILAIVLVYMVLVSLYESLRDPFVVMFAVPPAIIGVLWMLFLTGTSFNMQSFIGCIVLGGIVVNNAIVLVDHINLLRRRDKMELMEAIEEAGKRRLRPILMTAFTTILGLFPMALGMGEGGELQAPLARATIGGLLSSTFITLIIVPVVYYVFESRVKQSKDMLK